jgi:ornithine--oxo-acid transaminase
MALANDVHTSRDLLSEIASVGVLKSVEKMSHEECLQKTLQYGTHNYHPIEVTIVKGDGPWVVDANGKRYIDCIGCYSALALGHLPGGVLATLKAQCEKLVLTGRAVYTKELALYLQVLCEYTGMDMACPMNTGAEAVETAIKLARKWAYTKKHVPDGKAEILVAEDNFHGRTTTIVGFSSETQYSENFGPFPAGFKLVPFGDLNALKSAITPNTAAVLIEPIQAEGGILLPPPGYMKNVRELCTANNVLLIWDEIQTGFCRTGKRFAWQHEEAEPDMMCLGKALGGGVLPVAAVVGRRDVMEVFRAGDHGSTFGGNPLASVVAIEAMAEMAAHSYEVNSLELGERFIKALRELNHPLVLEVRGRGLLVGLEVKEGTDTGKLLDAFLRNGILTKETRNRTFRFAPPVNSEAKLIDDAVSRISRALDEAA